MSADSTLVTARHFAYIASHATPEDDFLARLRAAASAAGIPSIQIAPEQAAFLQVLLRLAGAKQVVEVGTLAGYSAIAMARALPAGGMVHTIEIEERHARFAEEWAAQSDVADKVLVLRGPGSELLPRFETGSMDAAFLDADKSSYPLYLKECMRIVRKGGLILADNAFAFGQLFDESPTDREALAIRAFNEIVPATPGLAGIIVPMGDGVWVCVNG